jgi:hypothetical protein
VGLFGGGLGLMRTDTESIRRRRGGGSSGAPERGEREGKIGGEGKRRGQGHGPPRHVVGPRARRVLDR